MLIKTSKILVLSILISCIISVTIFAENKNYIDDSNSGPGIIEYTFIAQEETTKVTEILNSFEEKVPTKELIGVFKTTAYCLDDKNVPKRKVPITATGTTPTVGRTVGTNWSVIPAGTRIMIGDSNTIYTVEDTGNVTNTVDIFMSSYNECIQYGVKYLKVYRVD